MIFESPPYCETHRPMSPQESIDYDRVPGERNGFQIQSLTSLMRINKSVNRLMVEYSCFPSDSSSVQLVQRLQNVDEFWRTETRFAQKGLHLSRLVARPKLFPAVLHAHYSETDYSEVEDYFLGRYEHIWLGSPGLGRSRSPIILDPFDGKGLLDAQHEHQSRLYPNQQWKLEVDPWHDHLMLANLLLIRVAAKSDKTLGDFWIYCPNLAGISIQDSIANGVALLEESGFQPVFVSDPIPLWREESAGHKGGWVTFETPIELRRIQEILDTLGYL